MSQGTPQQILISTRDIMKSLFNIKVKSLPYVVVFGVAGLVGYFGVRQMQTPRVLEKPIKLSTLEEKVYVTISGTHFKIDERVGKTLEDLERELREKLGEAYEFKKNQVNDKYDKMTGEFTNEAKKAWGFNEIKPEKKEETSYHENIKELNKTYDAILNFGKKKK